MVDALPLTSMATNNANTASSCQKENESLENDTLIESNASRDVIEKNTFNLQPVSPFTSGEGLPYAPEGWPNPGDIWAWKVGRRTSKAGYYFDRFLYPPRSLEKTSSRRTVFLSKPDVERFIKSNFANMEIGAFFALFSWRVPSTELPPTEAMQSFSVPPPVKSMETGKHATEETSIPRKLKQKARLHSLPTRKSCRRGSVRFPPVVQDANAIIDLCSLNEDANIASIKDVKGTSDSAFAQPINNSNGQPKEGSGVKTAPEKSPIVTIAENFDEYLSTLEDILVLPSTETLSSDTGVPATNLENEMIECRTKLSSLLAMDFSSLVYSDNLAEVATLASQLRKDPTLSIDQLIKIKLVEEIPLVSETFKEAKGNIEAADKFFADLEANKLKVPSLKKEYSELKDKVAQIQAEIDRSSSTIHEIDDQILQLQSKRKEMSGALEAMHKRKLELTSTQAMLANSIPTIVGEIQHANSEKPKWEQMKANCAQRVAEIQERFVALSGLTF